MSVSPKTKELIAYFIELNEMNPEDYAGIPVHDLHFPVRPKLVASVPQDPKIFLNQEQFDKWFSAMESGQYAQAGGRLTEVVKGTDGQPVQGFCCLGLLQYVTTGETEFDADGCSLGLPSPFWLAEHNITFTGLYADPGKNPHFIVFVDGDTYKTNAAQLNDLGFTFKEIAELLRPLVRIVS
jgi:hypothetical protein